MRFIRKAIILIVASVAVFVNIDAFVCNRRRRYTASTTSRHMFTGIVEEMGTVTSFEKRDDMVLWDGSTGTGTELTIEASGVLEGAYLGCSICVSGVCLTATELTENTFKVGLAPETLDKTYFQSLKSGDAVNLERASEIGGRNSGHFVQGHVDGVGEIIDKWVCLSVHY